MYEGCLLCPLYPLLIILIPGVMKTGLANIILNFPCLIACLLCVFLCRVFLFYFILFFACFVVRDLGGSGCRQNCYLILCQPLILFRRCLA